MSRKLASILLENTVGTSNKFYEAYITEENGDWQVWGRYGPRKGDWKEDGGTLHKKGSYTHRVVAERHMNELAKSKKDRKYIPVAPPKKKPVAKPKPERDITLDRFAGMLDD